MKNITRVFALVVAASLVTFTGCKSYDDDITGLQGQIDKVVTDVAGLKTSVAALQTSVTGMTYIKSITMDAAGKLTITPSTGANIVYDAKNYVTYDISLTGNNLMVNGVNKGTVVLPALTFKDGQLLSGTTVVADLAKAMTLGADNFLYVGGVKTSVAIPAATVPSVDVKSITAATVANVTTLTITMNDNSVKLVTIPAEAITLASSYNATTGEVTLTVNGVTTKVIINNTYTVSGGFLYVNGVKTSVAIPAENKTSVIYSKDLAGNITSATISDGKDVFTVKLNPSSELLSSILFVPTWIDGGVNTVEAGFIEYIPTGTNVAKLALWNAPELNYRFNPTSADVSKTTWKFLTNSARMTVGPLSAPKDSSNMFAVPTYTNNGDGSGKFSLKIIQWIDAGKVADNLTRLFALQGESKDFYSGATSYVVSDYAKLVRTQYDASICNPKKTGFVKYSNTAPAAIPAPAAEDHKLIYDAAAIDLTTLVMGAAGKTVVPIILPRTYAAPTVKFSDLKFNDIKWVFSKVANYDGTDTETDQNAFVTLNGSMLQATGGISSVDRCPLIKVVMKNLSDSVLATGFITFRITRNSTMTSPYVYTTNGSSPNYNKLFKGNATLASNLVRVDSISWTQMNALYTALGMTHNEFKAAYNTAPTLKSAKYGTKSYATALQPVMTGTPVTGMGRVAVSPNAQNVDTYAIAFEANPLARFGANTVQVTFISSDTRFPDLQVNFSFNVQAPPAKTIAPAYQYAGYTTPADKTIITQGVNAGGSYKMTLQLGEAFGLGATDFNKLFAATPTADKINGAKHYFKVTDNYNTVAPAPVNPSFNVDSTYTPIVNTNLDQVLTEKMAMHAVNKLDIAQRVYPTSFRTGYPNGDTQIFDYNIIFRNPLKIIPAPVAKFTFTDFQNGTADNIDLSKNYTVTMLGDTVFSGVGLQANHTTNRGTYGISVPLPAAYAPDMTTLNPILSTTPPVFSFTYPTATWNNLGTRLTNTVKVLETKFTFDTSFAVLTNTTDINAKPDPAATPVKKK